jgi:hypothetical protein
MVEYNKPFFKLYETFFLKLMEKLGRNGIKLWKEVMHQALNSAYIESGAKKGGGIDEFIKVVGERDKGVGLIVSFEKTNDGFIYRFYTDPFPGLKGKTELETLVDTYLSVKRDFFLGKDWDYKTTKHIWNGDEYSEHIFTKSK